MGQPQSGGMQMPPMQQQGQFMPPGNGGMPPAMGGGFQPTGPGGLEGMPMMGPPPGPMPQQKPAKTEPDCQAFVKVGKGDEAALNGMTLKVDRDEASAIGITGNGLVNISGGSIKVKSKEAPLIEVVGGKKSTITLEDVCLSVRSGVLMHVGVADSTAKGCAATLVVKGGTYDGCITAEANGRATVKIKKGTWNLTADSEVARLVIESEGRVNRNGHKLKYNSLNNNGMLD